MQARTVLEDLPPAARQELIHCMRSVENILTKVDRGRIPYVLRPHRVGDMGWVIHREGIGYAEQYGWDATFEALVAKIASDFITNFEPGRERCWIAELDGQSVGHIFPGEASGRSRTRRSFVCLFVEPSTRGTGLGEALSKRMRAFRARGRLSKARSVDPEHSYRRASHLPKGRIPAGNRRTPSQLWPRPHRPGMGIGSELSCRS